MPEYSARQSGRAIRKNDELGNQNTIDTYVANAIEWAKEQLGSPEYATLCLKFVEDAYEIANGIVLDGYSYAKESAEAWSTDMQTGEPRAGSYVFYDCSGIIGGEHRNWGHVGLATDKGNVIHVWDTVRLDYYLEIENLNGGSGWNSPKYTGWVPVAIVMKGMVPR